MGLRIGAAALVLGLAIVVRMEAVSLDPAFQKTTKDGLYSKEQATRGAAQYVKFCEQCHTPEKVPANKKPAPVLTGPKFLEAWLDRPLGELYGTIFDTMPSDGSTTLTPEQALDAVAYILQINGYPDGPTPLKNDAAMKSAMIVK